MDDTQDMMTGYEYLDVIGSEEQFVESLFNYNVLVLKNDYPDVRDVMISCDADLWRLVQEELGEACIQAIVENRNKETRVRCPFFRVFQSGVSASCSTNFKLQSFFQMIDAAMMNSRCTGAVVVGLSAMNAMESPISLPYCFTMTTFDPMDFTETVDEVDMCCLKPVGDELKKNRATTALCDIAGVELPYHVPWDVQTRILSYLRSPTADILTTAKVEIQTVYDFAMYTMFVQREPRIPAYLASYYHAATVASTTSDALKAFLVPAALRVPAGRTRTSLSSELN